MNKKVKVQRVWIDATDLDSTVYWAKGESKKILSRFIKLHKLEVKPGTGRHVRWNIVYLTSFKIKQLKNCCVRLWGWDHVPL